MADSEDEYTTDSDSSYLEEDFVYCRSRGRSRKEDSRKRRYRKKMRARGHRSPESEERRSLTPYNWNSKKMIKSSKSHKKKQIKAKKAFGLKKDSKDTLNKHDTSHQQQTSSTEKLERKGDKQIPQNENRTPSNDSYGYDTKFLCNFNYHVNERSTNPIGLQIHLRNKPFGLIHGHKKSRTDSNTLVDKDGICWHSSPNIDINNFSSKCYFFGVIKRFNICNEIISCRSQLLR